MGRWEEEIRGGGRTRRQLDKRQGKRVLLRGHTMTIYKKRQLRGKNTREGGKCG